MPQAKKRVVWRRPIGSFVILAILAAVSLVLWNAWAEMRRLGVIGNFSVLFELTHWDLSSSVLPHSSSYPYWRTLAVAVGNTFSVGVLAIVFATLAGVALGVARTGPNKAASTLAKVYVEVFRNVPAIMQVIFWYVVLLSGPVVANAMSLGGGIVFTNRGLFFPRPLMSVAQTASIIAALLAGLVWLIAARFAARRERPLMSGRMAAVALTILILMVALPFATAEYEVPIRRGLNFRGGINITIEYLALLIGLTFFGAAYIAEIVRGGLNAVPRGQIEAGRALGLSPAAIFFRVRAPLALRLVIPPLSNQYLFLMKGTGLGIAVGFAELFQVTVTSINQTGKSIDFLVVMMLTYGAINFSVSKLMSFANDRVRLKGRES